MSDIGRRTVRLSIALAFLLAAGCLDLNLHRETYDSGAMARRFEADKRGIVPGFVPDEARDVTTANNTRTGAVWVRCELPGSSLDAASAAVQRVGWEAVRAHSEPAPSFLGAWHPVFESSLPYTPDAGSLYFIYHDASREWHGVIDPAKRLCFAYCVARSG